MRLPEGLHPGHEVLVDLPDLVLETLALLDEVLRLQQRPQRLADVHEGEGHRPGVVAVVPRQPASAGAEDEVVCAVLGERDGRVGTSRVGCRRGGEGRRTRRLEQAGQVGRREQAQRGVDDDSFGGLHGNHLWQCVSEAA